jgi:acyl carrier protein
MVPAAFVQLPALPLTSNGKVDRKALPVPRASVRSDSVSHPAPYNDVEKKIALVWKDVLGVATVGRDSNFFDLGGHSLLLARANIRLRQAFDKDITMLDMFRFATVRTLAIYLTGAADSNVVNARQPADGVPADGLRRRRQTRRHSAKELVKEPS